MRAVILSDIHANFETLKALDPLIADAELRICLGDLVGYYCQVNEVLDYVRSREFLCVRGNHDDYLIRGCPPDANEAVRFGIDYADRVIDPAHRKWLAGLPLVWGGFLPFGEAGRSALLCHGSPWAPLTDYLYAGSDRLAQLDGFDFELIAFGQTHRPLLVERGSKVLVNPGAAGQSRHRPSVACAALISAAGGASLIEIPYDSEPVIRRLLDAGAGDWSWKHLTTIR